MSDEEPALARVVVEDFACDRVLERLLMYERRIESSLYRTMGQLRRQQEARVGAEEAAARSGAGIPAGQEPAPPAELGSFGAEAREPAGLKSEVASGEGPSSEGPDPKSQSSHRVADPPRGTAVNVKPAKTTPYGVTTNCLRHSSTIPDAPAGEPSCETNPIPEGRTDPAGMGE